MAWNDWKNEIAKIQIFNDNGKYYVSYISHDDRLDEDHGLWKRKRLSEKQFEAMCQILRSR